MIFGLGLVKFGSGQARVKFFSHFLVNFDQIHGWWSLAYKITLEEQYFIVSEPKGIVISSKIDRMAAT